MNLAEALKKEFPWLGTNRDAGSGADVIERLAEIYERETLKPVLVRGRKQQYLVCPKCKGKYFKYEDIGNVRQIIGILDGVLMVDGLYSTDDCDYGNNGCLTCQKCFADFGLPKKLQIRFV